MNVWGQDTKYFHELTPERVLDAVQTHRGYRCSGRLQQLNSMENRVYQVELDLDESMSINNKYERDRIIKFYRPGRWTEKQILEEHQFLEDLQASDVPVVAPEKLENGSTLARLPDSQILYFIFPLVM